MPSLRRSAVSACSAQRNAFEKWMRPPASVSTHATRIRSTCSTGMSGYDDAAARSAGQRRFDRGVRVVEREARSQLRAEVELARPNVAKQDWQCDSRILGAVDRPGQPLLAADELRGIE